MLESATLVVRQVVAKVVNISFICVTRLEKLNFLKNMFVAGFIGSPSTNLIKVKLIEEDGMYWMINPDLKIDHGVTA